MTNLKLKAIERETGQAVYGDYFKDGQFQEVVVIFETDYTKADYITTP